MKAASQATDGKGSQEEIILDKDNPLSFCFPNFKTCKHWGELVCFLGLVWFQDTALFKQRLLSAKMMCQ